MPSLNANQLNKLFRSRNILLEILSMRGYNVENYIDFSYPEFIAQYTNEQLDILVKKDGEDKNTTGQEVETPQIYVKYHLSSKLTNKAIFRYEEDLFDNDEILNKNTDEIIIITNQMPNKTIKDTKDTLLNSQGKLINVMHFKNLQTNILKNDLVPKHTILSEEEKKKVMEKYNIRTLSQFPEIDRHEPVSCILGIRPGQLVEIERNSPTALTTLYYRICV